MNAKSFFFFLLFNNLLFRRIIRSAHGKIRKLKSTNYLSNASNQNESKLVVVEEIFDNNLKNAKAYTENRENSLQCLSFLPSSVNSSSGNADTAEAAAALLCLAANDSFIDVLTYKPTNLNEFSRIQNNDFTLPFNVLKDEKNYTEKSKKRKYRSKLKNLNPIDKIAFMTVKRLKKEKKLKKAAIFAYLANSKKNKKRKVFTQRSFEEENEILMSFGEVNNFKFIFYNN